MSGKNNFVFVVCGEETHIKTLNFSLEYLRSFSKNNIIVVTDKLRNKYEIKHDNVLDIKTPSSFNHHQASIYLKTGLHKFLDMSDNYCYLDSDVIALTPKVDEIFNFSYSPIIFAADHCKMDFFSPSAVNCGCIERKEKIKNSFNETVQKIIPDYNPEVLSDKKGRELCRVIREIGENPYKNIRLNIINLFYKYILNNKDTGAKWGENFRYSNSKNSWIDLNGNLIMQNLTPYSEKIKGNSNFSYSKKRKMWVDENDECVFSTKCNHLSERIHHKFHIDITQHDFQHWNGGVFLFNENSVDFLETWHHFTLEIFNDMDWKTRDQGTLIATVWKYSLQNERLLPKEFNFIADYDNPEITFRDDNGFTHNNFKTIFQPNFIHIYHQFGNKKWDIWQGVEKTLQKK